MDGCCKRCFRDDERFFFLPILLNIRLIRTINIRVSLFVKHLQRFRNHHHQFSTTILKILNRPSLT